MNVIGTGLSGLVGSRVVHLLSSEFSFENLSLETGVDITNKDVVSERIGQSSAPWVFHFAAKTDVDGAEKERAMGQKSATWKINAEATGHIVDMCKKTHKRMLYISTDFVFDGTKESYTEKDSPNPQSWYALTKYEGEKKVQKLAESGLIVRIAFPYLAHPQPRPDFLHRIISRLQEGLPVVSPGDQLFVPTFVDDIASAIGMLVQKQAAGVYHVVGSQALSPHEASLYIAKTYGLSPSGIHATTFREYFRDRAPRPFHAVLKNDKITKFGVSLKTFEEGLVVIRQQETTQ